MYILGSCAAYSTVADGTLQYAVRNVGKGTVDACQLLLDFGADINTRDRHFSGWHG